MPTDTMPPADAALIKRIGIIFASANPDDFDELAELAFKLCAAHARIWDIACRQESAIHDAIKQLEHLEKK